MAWTDQIKPAFVRGQDGKLFRNLGIGLTAAFAFTVFTGLPPSPGISDVFSTAANTAVSWGSAHLEVIGDTVDLVV